MGWHGAGMDLVWTMDGMVDGVLLCVLCAPCTAIAQLDFVSLYFLWQEHNNYVKLVLLLQGSLDASLPPLPPIEEVSLVGLVEINNACNVCIYL